MKIDLKSPPFQLPVRIEDDYYLLAHDCELIAKLAEATTKEKAYIVAALNAVPALVGARGMLAKLEEHLDWIGWGDSFERECAKDLRRELALFSESFDAPKLSKET